MSRLTDPDKTFIDLVDRYLDRVYRYLRSLTRDEDSARDFSHETFLRLHRQVTGGTTSAKKTNGKPGVGNAVRMTRRPMGPIPRNRLSVWNWAGPWKRPWAA